MNSLSAEGRYDQAYKYVEIVLRWAIFIRTVGFVLGVVAFVIGVYVELNLGVVTGLVTMASGFAAAILSMLIHLILSAQAQLLRAVLDTAVNTSRIS